MKTFGNLFRVSQCRSQEMDAYAIVTNDALTMVKARTGETLWSTKTMNTPVGKYLYDKQNQMITMVNMPRTFLGSVFKGFKNLWVTMEILNLLQISNTISYTWVRDFNNNQYGVPNYLTPRQINIKLGADF